ncbi:succinate dehydrogenase, subunit D [Lycorma delicatula]|uniref:succinate dehydrogenase, subunit D n=1 Tax=Lycorma delicatula TaxID=130591 RepID=UPI003F5156BC
MALCAILRRQFSVSKDLCVKPLNRSYTWAVLQNLRNGTKAPLSGKNESQLLQFVQTQKFSTSKHLLASQGSHDHSSMWTLERAVTVGLVVFAPLCIAAPSKLIDSVIALLLSMHMHWGLLHIQTDYIRKAVFGPLIPKVAGVLVYIFSVITLAGLFNLTYNQNGIGNTIRMFWKL